MAKGGEVYDMARGFVIIFSWLSCALFAVRIFYLFLKGVKVHEIMREVSHMLLA